SVTRRRGACPAAEHRRRAHGWNGIHAQGPLEDRPGRPGVPDRPRDRSLWDHRGGVLGDRGTAMTTGVSVIICVRNGEAYLRDALDSVAAQDMANLESIVIDDGSEDGSAAIAQSHAVRPRVISRPPSGYPASLNAGVEAASKDFVAFLDSDDVWP